MKCLVTGAGGQLASSLVDRAGPSIQIDAVGIDELDITNAEQVEAVVSELRPDVILNAAAWTDVDGAESDEDAAMAVNRDGPAHLADACARHGSRLMHVSTDFVFDGSGSSPCKVEDPTSPLSVYGRSKLAGEKAVRDRLGSEAVIVRTAWLYAAHGRNFVRTMLNVMSQQDHIKVVADQRGTPTSSNSLADAMWQLLDCDAKGLYHWTDAGESTWHEFAMAIHEVCRAGLSGLGEAAVSEIAFAWQPVEDSLSRPVRQDGDEQSPSSVARLITFGPPRAGIVSRTAGATQPRLRIGLGPRDLRGRHLRGHRVARLGDGRARRPGNLPGGEAEPGVGGHEVALDAAALGVQAAELALCERMPLLGGQAHPPRGLDVVPGNPTALRISEPQVELRVGVALVGGEPNQPHRFRVVRPDPVALQVGEPEVVLSLGMPWSVARRNQRTASVGFRPTPRPSAYIAPRFACACGSPCSAASRNHRTASAASCGTPRPAENIVPRLPRA